MKNAYPPFLINKVIAKYLNYKFSSNRNQLKDESDVPYSKLALNGNLSHHNILKINFRSSTKSFAKKISALSLFLLHSKLKISSLRNRAKL